MNTTVYGTGADLAVIQWVVTRIKYTPETYYVEYGDFTDDESEVELVRVQYPIINEDYFTTNREYRFVLSGLSPGRFYMFKIVAENSVGETVTPDFDSFFTRDQGMN